MRDNKNKNVKIRKAKATGLTSSKRAACCSTAIMSTNRGEFLKAFKPGSELSNVIGLCYDSLSEGVNLQQASSGFHLDVPSVMRISSAII